MTEITLTEKVKRNFSKVRVKKAIVKVPTLRIRKTKEALRKASGKGDKIPTSLLVKILIRNALDKAKRERKESRITEDKKYSSIKEEKEAPTSGYGAVSGFYGAFPKSSYVDYGKLFSYLGKFRAKNAYESLEPLEVLNKSLEASSFTLIDTQTMETGKRYVRYFHPKVPVDKTALVPPIAGMNSAEWEQFKLWMRLDTVMYLLKISTA